LADAQGNLRANPQTNGPMPNGTGFFVLVPNENGPGGYGYLVTAKHVLKDERAAFFSGVFIRINDKKGGSEFQAADLFPNGPNQNLFVHNDPTVDIAVIPAWPDETNFEFRAVPMEMIKTKEEFKRTTIAPGSDVFFAGLFVPHVGDKVNTPIFRFGRVAMLPEDRIRWQTDPSKAPEFVELYLLETMSFGGNSGSPVFFSQGADRQPGSIILGPPEITLAGVMSGSFNEPRPGSFIQTPNAVMPIFAQNVGIAAVSPAHLLREILYSERLKQFRASNPIKVPPP
jgi:Trypsin-like peptidase domain